MTRYFPEVVDAVKANFPERAVIDGEIVVLDRERNCLEFEVLQQRIHPAASRVNLLAVETPASFVAFDLLALGDEDLTERPFRERRARLEEALAKAGPPVHLTPITDDHAVAAEWFEQFEGAGLDGLIAKNPEGTYQPDKRVMTKIKHERTADCVVAGYRVHKSGPDAIGSLLLGLYQDDGQLASVGVIGAFPMPTRRALMQEMQPLVTTFDDHPWAWARQEEGERTPRKDETSRWNAGKDLSFVAAAARAGGRGALRLHGGRAVPAHRPVRALAPRPRAVLVHLRAAGAAGDVRPGRGAGPGLSWRRAGRRRRRSPGRGCRARCRRPRPPRRGARTRPGACAARRPTRCPESG